MDSDAIKGLNKCIDAANGSTGEYTYLNHTPITDKLDELADAITNAGGHGVEFIVVEELPASGEAGYIYLVPKSTAGQSNVYDEYIWTNDAWEKIGSTDVDLSGYYNKTETDTLLAGKVSTETGKGLSTNDYTTAEKEKLASLSPVDLSGYYNKTEMDTLLAGKVSTEAGKGLSTNDYTTAEKEKLASLSPVDLSGYYNKTETDTLLAGKVSTETGKGLSTNDYTTAEKTKLASLSQVTYYEVSDTLSAGETSITLTQANISASSRLLYFTDVFGVNPTNVAASAGSVTLTFEAQQQDVEVVVQVWPELPGDPEAGVKFTSMYTATTSGTYTITKGGLYLISAVFASDQAVPDITITSSNSSIAESYRDISKYYFINLDVGDTVAFAEATSAIYNVTLIKNATLSRISRYTGATGHVSYTLDNTDNLYFVFACCTGSGTYDNSVVGSKSTNYTYHTNDNVSFLRLTSCVGDDATIKMCGYGGGVSLLIAVMERV